MPVSSRAAAFLVLACWSLVLGNASACLWIRGTTIDGQYVARESDLAFLTTPDYLKKVTHQLPRDRKLELYRAFPESLDPLDQKSDAAVEVLLDGDAGRAVTMLEALEREHPGMYYTAANLGTAYELSGNEEKALQWIREGIRRNPDSHMKTEWLHVRILETRIKLKSDPAWLENHTITGADFSRLRDPAYRLQTLQRPVDAQDLHRSLWTQLSVRMLFVKPQDPIVAQLLKELTLVEAQTGVLEQATAYRQMAMDYGMPASELRAENEEWTRTIQWTNIKRKLPGVLYTAAVLLGVPLLSFLIWKISHLRRRKESAMKAAH